MTRRTAAGTRRSNAEGRFVYVPIPEGVGTRFHPGLRRQYDELLPALQQFCEEHGCSLNDLRFPHGLLACSMHLDPDFQYLTYGDVGRRRGAGMVGMREGDLLVFYCGLRPVRDCEQRLIYALSGMFVVREVVPVAAVPPERWHENAHVRKVNRGETDIVVRAIPGQSGRFEKCIPIGEWRNGAYRVRTELLHAWGGLSVKDGFIQRSAVPPTFINPRMFLDWLWNHCVRLIERNN